MSPKADLKDSLLISTPARDIIFENLDILALIFSHFTPALDRVDSESESGVSPFEGRRQLRNLALVCKAFSLPALDCLWANIDGITSLLKLHPGLKVVGNKYVRIASTTTAKRGVDLTSSSLSEMRTPRQLPGSTNTRRGSEEFVSKTQLAYRSTPCPLPVFHASHNNSKEPPLPLDYKRSTSSIPTVTRYIWVCYR